MRIPFIAPFCLAIRVAVPAPAAPGEIPAGSGDDSLHAGRVEEVHVRSQHFDVAGNLYLPREGTSPHPLVIWVSGSGPSTRFVKSRESVKLVNCFLDGGAAYFRIDKPGSGDSRGAINDDSVFAQLSAIVVDAVEKLRTHPFIDPGKIGLCGSSQAGYIMPKVIAQCPAIAFMIGSSCPGENSIEQWNYLLERQLACVGVPPARAKKSVEMFMRLRSTGNRAEFDQAVGYFDAYPMVIKSLGYDSSFSRRARAWWPRTIDLNDESHFDPITLMEKTRIPLFLAYGAHDRQIDPEQAISAYRAACRRSGNTRLRIALLPQSDHNMSLSGGCLNEIESLNRAGAYRFDPDYLRTMKEWIAELAAMHWH
ncbi:MAG TPA: hypothetical protein VMF59_09150 [Bacteroidota bacterium]|nr:hypothetical protein [Bacteroidota bacterium]